MPIRGMVFKLDMLKTPIFLWAMVLFLFLVNVQFGYLVMDYRLGIAPRVFNYSISAVVALVWPSLMVLLSQVSTRNRNSRRRLTIFLLWLFIGTLLFGSCMGSYYFPRKPFSCEDLSSLGAIERRETCYVPGDLVIEKMNITSLPENLMVQGDLRIRGTRLTSLPEGLVVSGDLDLYKTSIGDWPEHMVVKGKIDQYGGWGSRYLDFEKMPKGVDVAGVRKRDDVNKSSSRLISKEPHMENQAEETEPEQEPELVKEIGPVEGEETQHLVAGRDRKPSDVRTEAISLSDVLVVNRLRWVKSELMKVNRDHGIIYFKDDEHLVLSDENSVRVCERAGCSMVDSGLKKSNPWLSPEKSVRVVAYASRKKDVTFAMLRSPQKISKDLEMTIYDEHGVSLCLVMDEGYKFNNNLREPVGDNNLMYRTFGPLHSDGVLNTCGRQCCGIEGEQLWMQDGWGFGGWMDESQMLYAARGEFFVFDTTDDRMKKISVEAIPNRLLQFVGVTGDRLYRFFPNFNDEVNHSIYRLNLKTGEKKKLVLRQDNFFYEHWPLRGANPGTWILASPGGRRFVVVNDGKVSTDVYELEAL